jgi:hypothetical protein
MENVEVAFPLIADVIVPPPDSRGIARERVEKPAAAYALDWFMTFKKLPKEKLNLGGWIRTV